MADKLGWTSSRSASVLCDHEVVKLLSKYGAKSVKYYLLVDFTTYMQHTRYRIRDMMQDIFCLGWASPSWASLGTKSARVSEVALWSRDGIFKAVMYCTRKQRDCWAMIFDVVCMSFLARAVQ